MITCPHNLSGLCKACSDKKPYTQFKLCKKACLNCNECGYFWGPGHETKAGQRVESKQTGSSRTTAVLPLASSAMRAYEEIVENKKLPFIAPGIKYTLLEKLDRFWAKVGYDSVDGKQALVEYKECQSGRTQVYRKQCYRNIEELMKKHGLVFD